MALQDLNEEINRREYEGEKGFHTGFDPVVAKGTGNISFDQEKWDASQKPNREKGRKSFSEFLKRHKKAILFTIFGILAVLAVIGVFLSRTLLFADERVTVKLGGPTDVASAESVTYPIHWVNDNILGINDLEITITFPQEFRPDAAPGMTISGNTGTIKLGDVKGNAFGDVKFSGKFYGTRGSLIYFRAVLLFTPVGISGRYESTSNFGVTIVSSPLTFDVIAPQKAASGNEVEYIIQYRNGGDVPSQNLRVNLTYPEGFLFNHAVPTPTEGDSVFRLGTLAPNTGGEIHVNGTLTGGSDQAKPLIAEIGVLQGDGSFLSYDREEQLTRMVVLPFSIEQKVNEKADVTASPGDSLSYQIDYMNNGDIGLRDAIVTMDVNPDLLDMSKLVFGSSTGSYDAQRKMITWKAADVPGLALISPKQKGTIKFSVPVRGDISTGNGLIIKTVAKIDSLDVPFSAGSNKIIVSNAINVRIGAKALFEVSVVYNDPAIAGYGPVPLQVGQETGYALRFHVANSLNDLSGVKVTATIPTDVKYAGKKSPESEAVSYNDRTGVLVWDIGTLQGGGKATRDLVIGISIVPSPNLVDKQPALLQDAVLEGTDMFTKEPLRTSSGAKTTAGHEGSGIPQGGGMVKP